MLDEKDLSAEARAAEDSEPTSASADEAAEEDPVRAERDRLLAEKQELFERLQRAQAEFDNARKRMERERTDVREYAAMDTAEALLPIIDDFDRALETPGVDPDFHKGLTLIRDRLLETLTRAGLQPIAADGYFDPNLHEAVDRGPAESDEDDQKILDVYRTGYKFKDRLLRAAMVKVAVKD